MKNENELTEAADTCQSLIDSCYEGIANTKRKMEVPSGEAPDQKRLDEIEALRTELIELYIKLSYRFAQRDTLKWVMGDLFWGDKIKI